MPSHADFMRQAGSVGLSVIPGLTFSTLRRAQGAQSIRIGVQYYAEEGRTTRRLFI